MLSFVFFRSITLESSIILKHEKYLFQTVLNILKILLRPPKNIFFNEQKNKLQLSKVNFLNEQ